MFFDQIVAALLLTLLARDIYELIVDNIVSEVPEELKLRTEEKKLEFLIKINDLGGAKEGLISNTYDCKLPYRIPLSWLSPEKAKEVGYEKIIDHSTSRKKIELNYPAITFSLSNLTSTDGRHIRCTMARLEGPLYRLKMFLLPLILTSLANMPTLASFLCLSVTGSYLSYLFLVWYKFFYFKNWLISLARAIGTAVEIQIASLALYVSTSDPDFEGKDKFGETAQYACVYAIIIAVISNSILAILIIGSELIKITRTLFLKKGDKQALSKVSAARSIMSQLKVHQGNISSNPLFECWQLEDKDNKNPKEDDSGPKTGTPT